MIKNYEQFKEILNNVVQYVDIVIEGIKCSTDGRLSESDKEEIVRLKDLYSASKKVLKGE